MPRSVALQTIAASGVFAVRLDGRSRGQQLLLRNRVSRDDRGETRFAFGERAGLIHDERIHFLHPLDSPGVLYEHARLRASTDADHDRHRRGESECARASDDQHRDCVHDPVRETRFRPEPDPRAKGQQRDADNGRINPAGYFVGQSLNRRAATLRIRDHLDDLGEHRLAADALGFHEEAAGPVDGSAAHLVTGRLFDRHRLAGKHRFIDARLALYDAAIDGHFLAGAHTQMVPALHLIERQFAFRAIANDVRGGRREIEQGANRVPRPVRARSSKTCPSSTSTVITAAASK